MNREKERKRQSNRDNRARKERENSCEIRVRNTEEERKT